MEPWVWLVVYLVGFALLQVILYRYVRDEESSSEQPAGSPGDRHGARADAGREHRAESATEAGLGSGPDVPGDVDGVRCKHCGALNEQGATFRYCRECTQPIQ
ncbi:MAG: hypothetical protein V5A39_08880 [Haloarculaceae archaeon]|jgi:hypothetical protein